jgi:GR25 family glycosyltransferase involved in LPS biosynthesis
MLQAGGREPSAKQKAFGTAFATATSPASYLASKNPHVLWGGFFDAWLRCGSGGVGSGVSFTAFFESYFLQRTAGIGTRCLQAPATSGLTSTTFSWKAIPVQYCMNGAFGRRTDHRKRFDDFIPNLWGTPGWILLLETKNSFLNLERQSVGISVRGTTSILKPFNSDVFVSVKDFVACFAGNSELTANSSHFLAIKKLCH